MTHKFIKAVTRHQDLLSVKAWWHGDCVELKKWIGWNFSNHLFIVENGKVVLYYDEDEGVEFDKILKEKLNDDFFDELVHFFLNEIEKNKDVNSNEDIFNLMVRLWPAYTIFDEISCSPSLVSEINLRRLDRLRKRTEAFPYDVEKRIVKENQPENYIFYKGKVFALK